MSCSTPAKWTRIACWYVDIRSMSEGVQYIHHESVYNHGIVNWDISRGRAISGGIAITFKNQIIVCSQLTSQPFLN